MAKTNYLTGYKLFVGIFILALGFLSILIPAESASAAPCPANRVACNGDENRARNACFAGRPTSQGAIWMNNADASATDTGYYAYGVNVGATDTVVNITIRGSVYVCGQGAGTWQPSYAVEVQPDTVGGAYPDSARLGITGGGSLYRGNFQGVNDVWTTQGGSVTGTLNVSGLATNNANGTGSQTITIGIFRCYSTNGVTRAGPGSCSTALIPVTIYRARLPGYNLTPTVTVNPSTSIESGQTVTATPAVTSAGGGNADAVTWQVSRFVVPPSTAVPVAGINPTLPLAYYGNGATTEASNTQGFPPGTTLLPDVAKVSEDLLVGSKICYALSVNPYTNDNALGYWYHSAPACVVVAKKPKVQVLGNDLMVGRATSTNPAAVSKIVTSSSYSSNTGLYYGSWSEYAIIPSGTVAGMASGAMYVDGDANDLCRLSLLTISNAVSSGSGSTCQEAQIGQYAISSLAPNVSSRFPVPTAGAQIISSGTQNLFGLAPGLVYTSNSPNLSINSSAAFGAGRWVVINAPKTTVTITSDLNYTPGSLSGLGSIPQIVIIAKNIIISDAVKNIDAWLIATGGASSPGSTAADGVINTCGAGGVTATTLPTSLQCTEKLVINGPVMANHLLLRRTAGSGVGPNLGDPAEVFNLRGDAFIWATSYSPGNGRLPTISSKELPPKF
ncbi:MAG: exported protein of unknown function [Candidatus Saccharibacteria bacterium]|nr:exported protein of unknown function [Candidatus Saccharibacteria bacterium]